MCIGQILYLGNLLPNFEFDSSSILKITNSIDHASKTLTIELTSLKNEKEMKELEYRMQEQVEK